MSVNRWSGAIVAMGLAGCGMAWRPSAFAPIGADRWQDGYRAAVLTSPAGDVEVASFGFVELAPHGVPPMTTLHVRLVVANERDADLWSLDVQTIALDVAGVRQRPVVVNSDVATLPVVAVARGTRATVDAYFRVDDEGDLGAFHVGWKIRIGARTATGQLAFVSDDAPVTTATVVLPTGWGPRWWCDPAHPWPLFDRRPGPGVHRAPAGVAVVRPARRHQRR